MLNRTAMYSNSMESGDEAKALLASRGFGILSTLSSRVPDFPFASIVMYTAGPGGSPIFLLSHLAVHTTNLLANPNASLLVFAESLERDPLNSARANFFGIVTAISKDEIPAARDLYLARHPEAAQWIDFGDFALYRMSLAQAYYVGGFGVMGWIGTT